MLGAGYSYRIYATFPEHWPVTNAIIFVYLLVVLLIGMFAGRHITSIKQYAIAGKAYGPLVIFATLSASFIGGGFSMGNAEKVFLVGVANIVALWGFSLKEILVAGYIAPRMDRYPDAISVGDVMVQHYGKTAKIFSGVFGFILCAGILGAQIGAIGYVTNLFLGIDRVWGILLGCGIVIAYSTAGGMRAVVWTDVVQFVVLLVGMPLTLYFGVQSAGGFDAVLNAVPAENLRLPSDPLAIIALVSLFLTFVVGETMVPPYFQRLLIGRDVKAVSRGTLYSGLFSIPFFLLTGLIGLVALALDPGLNPNLAMPYVIQEAVPPVLKGIVIAAILSIVMSSADSFLNSAAICFSNDIVKPLRKTPLSDRADVLLARLITLVVGVLAVAFALSIDSVLDILIYSYNFWAPIILVPLVLALLGWQVSSRQFLFAAVAGALATLVWDGLLDSPGGFHGLVVGVIVNFIVFQLAATRRKPA